MVTGPNERQLLQSAGEALGLKLSDQQLERLMAYRDALLKWNRVYNLTAIRQPQEMLRQHLIDCLAIVPAIQRQQLVQSTSSATSAASLTPATSAPARFNILDVGSGGGLPGVVLAITMPGVTVDCVDAVGKKAAFVRQVAGELGLPNLHAHHSRVESLRPPAAAVAGYHLITSRAFASLADFTAWTAHLLAPGGAWAAMKGQQPDDEIQALGGRVEMFHVEPLAPPGMTAQRCLVWMRPRPAVAPQP